MTELEKFIKGLKELTPSEDIDIVTARRIVNEINKFLFTTHNDIGTVFALGRNYQYFSNFHKYWDKNYKDILNVIIDDEQCKKVAIELHTIFVRTRGKAFEDIYDTYGLNYKEICRVRFLTANQDFRGSRSFEDLTNRYKDDPSIFDVNIINESPESFIKNIGISNLSQNDKRISYAKKITSFLLEKNINEPYELINYYENDVLKLKNDLLSYQGSGYGNKKIDMFIRDMIVLGVWKNVINFESINVASDVNTIKVALRTGILKTSIPLVSSFLDFFGVQYSYIDDMSAQAWRRVWEKWKELYPTETISSPCLLDYLIYNVIGRTMCKEGLVKYKCDTYNHEFFWHTSRNKTCQICYKNGQRNTAHVIRRQLPCDIEEGLVYIKETEFYKSNICVPNISSCPFKEICNEYNNKTLQAPKSISIEGATGWSSAYTDDKSGGGGLMS